MSDQCLADLDFAFLQVRCRRCDRRERKLVSMLATRLGKAATMATLKEEMEKECPNVGSPIYQGCDVYFPQIDGYGTP